VNFVLCDASVRGVSVTTATATLTIIAGRNEGTVTPDF
jgi:3-hydroxyisobutyrate dehydrogenase-like beta-hydroxyacid dehydrogenase